MAVADPTLLLALAAMSVFYVSAIVREEREMLERVPTYAEYRARTGCLVPRLW